MTKNDDFSQDTEQAAEAHSIAISDEEIESRGWFRPVRRTHSLHGTPRVGQVFWVDFPRDNAPPEFDSEHPGVIVKAAQNMQDHCIIVPLTHRRPTTNSHAIELTKNPDKSDPEKAYAICNHLYTVSLGRLRRMVTKTGNRDPVRLDQIDLDRIFQRIQLVLHAVYKAPMPALPPGTFTKQPDSKTLSLPKKPDTEPKSNLE